MVSQIVPGIVTSKPEDLPDLVHVVNVPTRMDMLLQGSWNQDSVANTGSVKEVNPYCFQTIRILKYKIQ